MNSTKNVASTMTMEGKSELGGSVLFKDVGRSCQDTGLAKVRKVRGEVSGNPMHFENDFMNPRW